MTDLFLDTGATISECGLYRYRLWRIWDETLPAVAFCCLNPSTADATQDDPSIRRMMGFAQAWGRGGLVVVNLFAFRATQPTALKAVSDPVGPDNDDYLCSVANQVDLFICAWGNHGVYRDRGRQVLDLLSHYQLFYLRMTGQGEPAHPLHLPASLEPIPYVRE